MMPLNTPPLLFPVLLACSLLLVSCGSRERAIQDRVDHLTTQLDLSPEQAQQVQALYEDFYTEQQAMRAQMERAPRTPETRQAMQLARQSLQDSLDQRVIALLTEDQRTRYRAMEQQGGLD